MANARERRMEYVLSMPDVKSTDVIDEDIARRAYELYEQRGGAHGHDVDDWLQAERELRSMVTATAA